MKIIDPNTPNNVDNLSKAALREIVERNLTSRLSSGGSIINLVNEFGASGLLIAYGSSLKRGVSLSFQGLVDWVVQQKIRYVSKLKMKSQSGVVLPKDEFVLLDPTKEQLRQMLPSEWLTNPQAARFMGVSRPTLSRLLENHQDIFNRLFPEEIRVRKTTITHGAVSQTGINVYNPFYLALIKWYRMQLRGEVESGSRTIHDLAISLEVDYETVARIVNRELIVDPSLGIYARKKGRKRSFYCRPPLVAIVEANLKFFSPPSFELEGYGWKTFSEIAVMAEKRSALRAQKIAREYELVHPEWIMPFSERGAKEAEYCHPSLVKIIFEALFGKRRYSSK